MFEIQSLTVSDYLFRNILVSSSSFRYFYNYINIPYWRIFISTVGTLFTLVSYGQYFLNDERDESILNPAYILELIVLPLSWISMYIVLNLFKIESNYNWLINHAHSLISIFMAYLVFMNIVVAIIQERVNNETLQTFVWPVPILISLCFNSSKIYPGASVIIMSILLFSIFAWTLCDYLFFESQRAFDDWHMRLQIVACFAVFILGYIYGILNSTFLFRSTCELFQVIVDHTVFSLPNNKDEKCAFNLPTPPAKTNRLFFIHSDCGEDCRLKNNSWAKYMSNAISLFAQESSLMNSKCFSVDLICSVYSRLDISSREYLSRVGTSFFPISFVDKNVTDEYHTWRRYRQQTWLKRHILWITFGSFLILIGVIIVLADVNTTDAVGVDSTRNGLLIFSLCLFMLTSIVLCILSSKELKLEESRQNRKNRQTDGTPSSRVALVMSQFLNDGEEDMGSKANRFTLFNLTICLFLIGMVTFALSFLCSFQRGNIGASGYFGFFSILDPLLFSVVIIHSVLWLEIGLAIFVDFLVLGIGIIVTIVCTDFTTADVINGCLDYLCMILTMFLFTIMNEKLSRVVFIIQRGIAKSCQENTTPMFSTVYNLGDPTCEMSRSNVFYYMGVSIQRHSQETLHLKSLISTKDLRRKFFIMENGPFIDSTFDHCSFKNSIGILTESANRLVSILEKWFNLYYHQHGEESAVLMIKYIFNHHFSQADLLENLYPTLPKTLVNNIPINNEDIEESVNYRKLTSIAHLEPHHLFLTKSSLPRLKVMIITVGSRGDVQPFLAIGNKLKEDGHEVLFVTHEIFQSFVESAGLGFFPSSLTNKEGYWQPSELMKYAETNPAFSPDLLLKPKELMQLAKRSPQMMKTIYSLFITPDFENVGTWAAAKYFNPNLIIANPPSYTGVHIAEKLGCAFHLIFTMPWSVTTEVGHPLCVVDSGKNDFRQKEHWNRISYRWVEYIQWRGMADATNDFRRRIGLGSVSSIDGGHFLSDIYKIPFTYCFSQSLLKKPSDWGPHIDIGGFCLSDLSRGDDEVYMAPARLLEFLNAGPKPFYIGFGSISSDLTQLYLMVIDAVEQYGNSSAFPLRVILHKGWCLVDEAIVGERISRLPNNIKESVFVIWTPPSCSMCSTNVTSGSLCQDCFRSHPIGQATSSVSFLPGIPHTWLFRRVCGVMHHGGAGTTALGISLALPTIVCAFFGDQPLWGSLIQRQGAGRMHLYLTISVRNILDSIQFCLTDGACRNAETIASELSAELISISGADACVLACYRQLPWSLYVCEGCVYHRLFSDPNHDISSATLVTASAQLRLCINCASYIVSRHQYNLFDGLSTYFDWGHTRDKGFVSAHGSSLHSYFSYTFSLPVDGYKLEGYKGCFRGVLICIVLILYLLIARPFLLIRDAYRALVYSHDTSIYSTKPLSIEKADVATELSHYFCVVESEHNCMQCVVSSLVFTDFVSDSRFYC